MKPAAKRTFSLLASAALLLASFGVYGIFVKPVYAKIVSLRGELRSKDEFLRKQNFILGKVDDLVNQFRGANQLQDAVSLSLPLDEGLASLFNQLRVLAAVNNLTIEVLRLKPLALKELVKSPLARRVGSLRLSLRLAGPYEGFKNFLRNLETNIRVMDVQSFVIEPIGSSSSADYFSYNLAIITYYQERKSSVGGLFSASNNQ